MNYFLDSRLFIVCQGHNGDLDNFFVMRSAMSPCSVSWWSLANGLKSDLLDCFSSLISNESVISKLDVDGYVLDGAVVVHMLKLRQCKTFEDYQAKVFVPHLLSMLECFSYFFIIRATTYTALF